MSRAKTIEVSDHRRRFLQGSVGAGIAAALGAPARGLAAPAAELAAFEKADIDWRAFKGQTLVLGAIEHPWTEAINPLIRLFEQLTGIDVRVLKQSEAYYDAAIAVRMTAKAPTPDVLMVNSLGEFFGGGWLAPLDPYYADRKLFDARWFDAADVFPAARLIPQWSDNVRYSQSITMEAQILFANRAMLGEAGLKVPQTFDDLYRAAVKTKLPPRAGISVRCNKVGSSTWVPGGLIFSNGGAIMENGRCVFDSEATTAALEFYVRLLRDAGPVPANHDWYEVVRDFGQGAAALSMDSSVFSTDFANPQKTPVAADVLYAPMPSNGREPPQANVWAWQAGINVNSVRKEAAFLFLCFVNSPPGCLLSAATGLATPRPSAWQSPAFRERFGPNAVSAALASANSDAAPKLMAALQHPKSTPILDALAGVIFRCVNEGVEVRRELKALAARLNRMLGKP